MAAFLWQALDRRPQARGRLVEALRLAGLTLFLAMALYAGLWVLFYAAPLAFMALKWWWYTLTHLADFIRSVGDFLRNMGRDLTWLPFTVLGTILGLYTATLFVLMPVAVPLLAARPTLRYLRHPLHKPQALPGTSIRTLARPFCYWPSLRQPGCGLLKPRSPG
jgi:hypothetical protein